MKNVTKYIISIATIAALLLAGCDSDTVIRQDSTPPLN